MRTVNVFSNTQVATSDLLAQPSRNQKRRREPVCRTADHADGREYRRRLLLPLGNLVANPAERDPKPCRLQFIEYQPLLRKNLVPRRFQWYIAEGMLSLPTAKWSMVISFFSGVMASGFAFGCAKDTVEFFNAGIGEVRFPVGEGFLLVIFDYVGPWV